MKQDSDFDHWFSARGDFVLQEMFGYLELYLAITTWGRGCYWHLVDKARHTAKHPVMHKTAPHNKNYSAPNVISAQLRNHDLDGQRA